jgi:ATP-dependent Lon protease
MKDLTEQNIIEKS